MKTEVLYDRYRSIAYEGLNPWDPAATAVELEANYKGLLPSHTDARILDVGCGMGQLLFYLKGKGYSNVAGVEISPEQVRFCKENVLSEVFLTTDLLSFLQQQRCSWDWIIMKDVVEHIPRAQVIPILGAVFEALAPAGRLLIETGNMASFTGPFLRYIDFTHESGFTEYSLRQVLRAVGFEEIQIRGAVPPLYSWAGSLVFKLARAIWKAVLRIIYRIERGPAAVPQVLDKLLVARAVKPL